MFWLQVTINRKTFQYMGMICSVLAVWDPILFTFKVWDPIL